MKYIIPGVLIVLFACNQKQSKKTYTGPATGRIVGGAFWQSKNHFGSYPPDAGCNVYLFKNDTSHQVIQTISNVDGNFIFYDLQDGLYLVLIKSHHIRANSITYFSQIDNSLCEDFIGINLRAINHWYYDSTKYFDSIYTVTLQNEMKETVNSLSYPELKKKEAWSDSCRNASAFRVLKQIPKTKLALPLIIDTLFPMKIHIEGVKVVDGKSKPFVVDFGGNDFE